jgi:tRNA U34 5-carboxymethylaminomethyl modifying enzyme MnmG/GidA
MNTIDITHMGPLTLEVLLTDLKSLPFEIITEILSVVSEMEDVDAAMTAYAIANDCITTSNPVILEILEILHP